MLLQPSSSMSAFFSSSSSSSSSSSYSSVTQDFAYFGELEEVRQENPSWDGQKINEREEMKFCSESSRSLQVISNTTVEENRGFYSKEDEFRAIRCPSCGHSIQVLDQGVLHDLPGLPAGVKFDPSDQEILQHLEAKVSIDKRKLHPLIDEFIPTIEGENGICYTHPERLPGVNKDGQIRHFFHRPSKAYTTGTRKRRKVIMEEENGAETRWHKTGKTRPIFASRSLKGYKKILVLYSNYGRHRKPEKTNWIMHQYHLGNSEEEKDGELVVSKVFYQTQPRQSNPSLAAKEPYKTQLETQWQKEDMIKNINVLDYNFSDTNNYVTYSVGCSRSSESTPLLIPNLVDHSEESSFMDLPCIASKGK